MATPDFIAELRTKVGHAPLWLPGVTAVVLRKRPDNPMEAPEVLLVRRADDGRWTPVTGIVDPGEQPHVAAVREVEEETGVRTRVEALLGVGAVGPVTYSNGDVASYMDTALRLSVEGDETPRVADDESSEVGWFNIMHMPPMDPRFRLVVADAVAQMRKPEGYKPRLGFEKHRQAPQRPGTPAS